MKKIKLLIAIRRLDKGGAELLEKRLAENLNSEKINCSILGQYNHTVFNGKIEEEYLNSKDIPVYWLNTKRGMWYSIKFLILLIQKEKINFIISHHSGLDILIGIACFFTKAKHIIAFHEYYNIGDVPFLKKKIWSFFIKKAKYCYSITNYVKTTNSRFFKLSTNKIQTIYNSIQLPKSKKNTQIKAELDLCDDSKLIILSGRTHPNKGFDIALKTLDPLLENPLIHIVILGTYTSDVEKYHHEDLIHLTKLKSNIHFLGFRDDLSQIYTQCNVYVHLARHEGFGLVLLDAIAAGIPIVASNVGGIPEVLANTPYKCFELTDKQGILGAVKHYISWTEEEKTSTVNKAAEILPFFTDERRAKEIEHLLLSLN